jgi:hypothetical protein
MNLTLQLKITAAGAATREVCTDLTERKPTKGLRVHYRQLLRLMSASLVASLHGDMRSLKASARGGSALLPGITQEVLC